MPNKTVPRTLIDPNSQVPLLDRLTAAGRELLGRARDVAGDWIVNATGPAPVAELVELLDLGLIARTSQGAYRLTSRGAAVWLFVPRV